MIRGNGKQTTPVFAKTRRTEKRPSIVADATNLSGLRPGQALKEGRAGPQIADNTRIRACGHIAASSAGKKASAQRLKTTSTFRRILKPMLDCDKLRPPEKVPSYLRRA
jgi:hypothetical protein